VNRPTTFRQLAVAAALSALVGAASGCGPVNKLIAKDTLNNGVREFNKGRYPQAEQLFVKALDYDPDNKNAKLFYAMTLNAQLKRAPSEELGLKTIDAYKAVVEADPSFEQKDKAAAFIAEVYRTIIDTLDTQDDAAKIEKYKEARRQTLIERANLPGQTKEVQAQTLYSLGQAYWQEVNLMLRAYEKRTTPAPGAAPVSTYDVPPEKQAQARELINKGHELMAQALAKDPDYADAFAYEKLLFLEELKFETDAARKKELNEKAQHAQDMYLEKNSLRQRREAEAAAAAEAPPQGE
jgi:hypothetical protein